MKKQFGFQKIGRLCKFKKCCKINVLVALTNLFLAPRQLLLTS